MKYSPLQEDFSAGELTPKAQGHVTADVHKSGLKQSSNCAPSRAGSVASRAGGRLVTDALGLAVGGVGFPPTLLTAVESRGLGVRHISVIDSPIGDFIIEVGPSYLRLLNKHKGVLPWTQPLADFTPPNGAIVGQADCWGDPLTDTVYLNNRTGVGQRIWSPAVGIPPSPGAPAGTDDGFTLTGSTAGDQLTMRVTLAGGANPTQDYALPVGRFLVNFSTDFGGFGHAPFSIKFMQAAGAVRASTVWGVKLVKNGQQTISPLNVCRPNEVQAVAFWTGPQFWVVLGGGGMTTPKVLRWAANSVGGPDSQWTLEDLPFVGGPPDWVAKVAAVAAYQGRLWFGLNDDAGSLHASQIGYGPYAVSGLLLGFNFATVESTKTGYVALGGQTDFNLPAKHIRDSSVVTITRNNSPYAYTSIELNPDQDAHPGGIVHLPAQLGGETIVITLASLPKASDPLDLRLASPAGRVVWMNVLHGLVLGSTQMEKTFTQGVALAIDPATGQSFDIEDHSSLGSDEKLPAVNVNQKILFLQRGRQLLREAAVRITPGVALPLGGLIAEDVSALGEHLLKHRVRSFCFLKSPVPRLVFAFDNGEGAVATLGGKAGYAWSRLSIPPSFGGIYSVCAKNGTDGSELWIGTGCGASLQFDVFESDVIERSYLQTAVAPFAAAPVLFDTETPLPPILDGWVKSGVIASGADYLAMALPEVFSGLDVWTHKTLADGQSHPNDVDVTVDDDNIYWVNYDTAEIRRVAKTGGVWVQVVGGLSANPGYLATDGEFIYYADSDAGTINKVSVAGGAPVVLASGHNLPVDIIVDFGTVYWADWGDGTVWRVRKDGSDELMLATVTAFGGEAISLAVDNNYLYIAGQHDGAIFRVPVGGGATEILYQQDHATCAPVAICVDENGIYFVDAGLGVALSRIFSLPLDGGVPVLLQGNQSAADITVFAGVLYWSNFGDGTVAKCLTSGLGFEIIFAGGVSPNGLDADTSGVYWTDWDGGTVNSTHRNFKPEPVWVMVAGQVFGPYDPILGGTIQFGNTVVVIPAAAGIRPTWVDADGNRRATEVYVGAPYPEHKFITLPLDGGSQAGSAQGMKSRKPQLYLRFVDSYMPKVNGVRPAERDPQDKLDLVAGRVTGDRRATELGFTRAAVIEVVMDFPLRFEVSAIFGGTQVNDL